MRTPVSLMASRIRYSRVTSWAVAALACAGARPRCLAHLVGSVAARPEAGRGTPRLDGQAAGVPEPAAHLDRAGQHVEPDGGPGGLAHRDVRSTRRGPEPVHLPGSMERQQP